MRFSLSELVDPEERLREALDRRERRPQVVACERDETGKVVCHARC